jgi:Uma2 family endonuclease
MSPLGWEGSIMCSRLVSRVDPYVEAHDLGVTLCNDPGFRLDRGPDQIRAPDLAFVAKERVPADRPVRAFPDLAPDLVAEVVSPWDRAFEVQEKVQQWLSAGVRLVWVLYPSTRTVMVYRSMGDVDGLTDNDELSGEELLPGFRCPVRDLFPY